MLANTSTEVHHWLAAPAGTTASSAIIHHEFLDYLKSLPKPSRILDVGCCSGEQTEIIEKIGHSSVGIDPNYVELHFGKVSRNSSLQFIQSFGEMLPFQENTFDAAVLLAVLGAVGKSLRECILLETLKVLRPQGLLYFSDFCRITDPDAITSNGKYWREVYEKDKITTGEMGSVIVHNPNGSTRFVGHHFTEDEIFNLLKIGNLKLISLQKSNIVSTVSQKDRQTWNVWAAKN